MPASPSFLFSTCQLGAEAALKAEMARREPDLHLAFSRPGFVTFKLPPDRKESDVPWQSAFARTQGFSLGKSQGNTASLAAAFWQLAGDRKWDRLHVWQRDTAHPGFHGFEPAVTPAAGEAHAALRAALADLPQPPITADKIDLPTRPAMWCWTA